MSDRSELVQVIWRRIAPGIALMLLGAIPASSSAQAPLAGGLIGRTVELHAFHQTVTNNYGDWDGIYGRVIYPGERQTLFVDGLALRGFRERGVQAGVTHRFDWSNAWFQMIGVNAGDGAPLFPRYRADASIGRRWGSSHNLQTTAGASYVQSVTTLSDVAVLGALTWYAPGGFVLESGVRYNTSRPGRIKSHRIHALAMYTPNSRRSFGMRMLAGSEGWQIVSDETTLTQFSSQEAALSWRERIGDTFALNLQADLYTNPFYTRSGVTLGVARYW